MTGGDGRNEGKGGDNRIHSGIHNALHKLPFPRLFRPPRIFSSSSSSSVHHQRHRYFTGITHFNYTSLLLMMIQCQFSFSIDNTCLCFNFLHCSVLTSEIIGNWTGVKLVSVAMQCIRLDTCPQLLCGVWLTHALLVSQIHFY